MYSDYGRDGERFCSKLRNSRRNEKIDLPCISVWGRTGLYYCQQIVACPSSKMFVKELKNWCQFIYLNLFWLQSCVLLPCMYCMTLKHLT